MVTTDLRIGNFIADEATTHIVCGIVKSSVMSYWVKDTEEKDLYKTPIEQIKPIPITEEWHNKFGVEKNGFGNFEYKLPFKHNVNIIDVHTYDYIMLRQGDGIPFDDDIISIWNRDITKRDMYVHEWQNLYHSLTGEELVIKKQVKN